MATGWWEGGDVFWGGGGGGGGGVLLGAVSLHPLLIYLRFLRFPLSFHVLWSCFRSSA